MTFLTCDSSSSFCSLLHGNTIVASICSVVHCFAYRCRWHRSIHAVEHERSLPFFVPHEEAAQNALRKYFVMVRVGECFSIGFVVIFQE